MKLSLVFSVHRLFSLVINFAAVSLLDVTQPDIVTEKSHLTSRETGRYEEVGCYQSCTAGVGLVYAKQEGEKWLMVMIYH